MLAKDRLSNYLAIFLASYLAIGAICGSSMAAAIPAISWKGEAYIAATWPLWMKVSPVKLPIPEWVFSFEESDYAQ